MTRHKLAMSIAITAISLFAQEAHAYWQQHVATKISVTLNDVAHTLRGDITMDYTNNSPDTLRFIYFHLYANAYKNDRTAWVKQQVENGHTEFLYADKDTYGYIDSLDWKVDDQIAVALATGEIDIIKLQLPKPLAPGAKTEITTPFFVKIPYTYSRLGHNGQSYQISQWFPKPSVYDATGWHPMPYLDQGEFYSEFGSYDVSISVPKNYVLLATGDLQDVAEQSWLDSLAGLPLPKEGVETGTPTSSSEFKTLRFTEDKVHDFAWFADKRWILRKDSVSIPERSTPITIYTAFFPEHSIGWAFSTDYVAQTIKNYGEEVGPYQYNTIKAVEGSLQNAGGMEYPTITVIVPSNSPSTVQGIIIHEVGHNWFYGMLANNERRYPWMDESINSYFENLTSAKYDGKAKQEFTDKLEEKAANVNYQIVNRGRNSQAVTSSSEDFTNLNYGADAYGRGAKNIGWLRAYMGDSSFTAGMHAWFDSKKLQHVSPKDFENAMRNHTEKNLEWFFIDAQESKGKVDFKISKIKSDDNYSNIYIKNKGSVTGPVIIDYRYADEPLRNYRAVSEPIAKSGTLRIGNLGKPISEAIISPIVPDGNVQNDLYKNGTSFHPRVGFLGGLATQPDYKMWIVPAIGYNTYDGLMAGLLLHNITLPEHQFQFAVAPMYSFGSNNLVGTGFASFKFFVKNSILDNIVLRLSGKHYGFKEFDVDILKKITASYFKVSPELLFEFSKPFARSTVTNTLTLKGYLISEQEIDFTRVNDSTFSAALGNYTQRQYASLQFLHDNDRTLNPYQYTAEGQLGKDFAKLSLDANIRIDYNRPNKALTVRGYFGKFFNLNTADPFAASKYRIAGSYTGRNDYLYDETYFGRNEAMGFWSQQISEKEGGMKLGTPAYANPLGLSDGYTAALNLSSDLPFGRLPIKIFGDVMTFSDAKNQNPSKSALLYDLGLQVSIFKTLKVNVPILYSQDYRDYYKSVYEKNYFFRTISFSLKTDLPSVERLFRKLM